MEILTYPSYLNSDDYALRKVTFTAMKNDAVEGEAEKMLQSALQKIDEWNNTGVNIMGAPEGFTSMGQIVLPIPATINDESSHSWGEETSILNDALKKLLPEGTDKMIATGALLSGRRKTLLDPGYFQNYTGSKPRSFAMQWNLIPQNSGDAKTIHDIIITFKKWAAPSKSLAGVTMLAPYFFNVQFSNPTISEMMRMDNCVCTGVDCSYSSQIFPDGMPRQINLSLRLAESRLTYSDNYNTGLGGGGSDAITFDDIGNFALDALDKFSNSNVVQSTAQNAQFGGSTPYVFNQSASSNSVIKPENA